MATVHEVRHANFLALLERYPTIQAFANAIERSHSQVSQLKNQSRHSTNSNPRVIGDDLARHIEQRLQLATGWLDTPRLGEKPAAWSNPSQNIPARSASNSHRVEWGAAMSEAVPDVFSVAIPDDSMAPRVKRGDRVRFQRNLDPRPGDGVLVSDANGDWYFRLYRVRRAGEWEAHPVNDAYQPLDAARDGLTLIAVLTGIEQQRWG
jgi:hypothetical protein